MSSRLQLDMRNLSLGRRHLVNAYEVKAGIGVIAGNTVWSMSERLECEVLQKARYINTLTFTFTFLMCYRFLCIGAEPLIPVKLVLQPDTSPTCIINEQCGSRVRPTRYAPARL